MYNEISLFYYEQCKEGKLYHTFFQYYSDTKNCNN